MLLSDERKTLGLGCLFAHRKLSSGTGVSGVFMMVDELLVWNSRLGRRYCRKSVGMVWCRRRPDDSVVFATLGDADEHMFASVERHCVGIHVFAG